MNVAALASQLKDGLISLTEWKAQMRSSILEEQRAAMVLTRGGVENVSQADFGYLGSSVKKQYAYLDQFAADIEADPVKWKTGRLDNRMRQYNQGGYSALEDFKARDMKITGWTRERRRLGIADHCHTSKDGLLGCVELAAKGWQPIGSLPSIGGDGAPCGNNCKCGKEYSRPGENGGWIYETNI